MIPEQKLWVAVLAQLAADALTKKEAVFGGGKIRDKREAVDFYEKHSRHLHDVCDNAGLEPTYVKRQYEMAKAGKISVKIFHRKLLNALSCVLIAIAASGCTSSKVSIPNVKACVAEYDAEGFIGTRDEYVDGCYRFAAVKF
jgi:hypothetical protein